MPHCRSALLPCLLLLLRIEAAGAAPIAADPEAVEPPSGLVQPQSGPLSTEKLPEPAPPAPEPPPPEPPPPEAAKPAEDVQAILGVLVHGRAGSSIGRVVDVIVGRDGVPRQAIIDSGGFMGVGSRRFALDWRDLRFDPSNTDMPLKTVKSGDEIRLLPDYKGTAHPAPTTPSAPAAAPEPQTPAPAAPPPPATAEPSPAPAGAAEPFGDRAA